jgi:hypothetical protein
MGLFNNKTDSTQARLRALFDQCAQLPGARQKFILDVVQALLRTEIKEADNISDKIKLLHALIVAQPPDRQAALFNMLDDIAKAEEKPPS